MVPAFEGSFIESEEGHPSPLEEQTPCPPKILIDFPPPPPPPATAIRDDKYEDSRMSEAPPPPPPPSGPGRHVQLVKPDQDCRND